MPAVPPPPFTVSSSGPDGVTRSGGDTLSTGISPTGQRPPEFKVEASKGPAQSPADKPKTPQYAPENAILAVLSTDGASLKTALEDNREAVAGGPEVSAKMAKTDQQRILRYLDHFLRAGKETGMPPAILAAIASRESRGGNQLAADGMGRSDSNGYGLMQVDIRFHELDKSDGATGWAHIRQASGIFADTHAAIVKKFPEWTPAQQMRGAVAAYNQGPGGVWTLEYMDKGSPHNDYSADTWERARYYASLPQFGGDGAIVEAAAQAGPQGRPALRKGRLIAQSVGVGGVNHEEDAARVLARLRELKVITQDEAADCSTEALGKYITRYQSMVNDGDPDGLMEPGRKTEDRMIAGVVTRSSKPAAEQGGKSKEAKQQAKTPSTTEGKMLAEYRRILRETPATEAGAEDILARGNTFAANAMADLARMGRFDLLEALQQEIWSFDRDWVAESIATRLSDAELAGLPKDFLAKLYEALDAWITTSGEYALMDKLEKAMGGSTAAKTGGKGTGAKQRTSSGKPIQPKETFVSTDDWRTQSPTPDPKNQKWEDSESGWENCKYVAEKMVYRHLYKDLSDDFLRAKVINNPGKYTYIVGSTGEHEYLSVQREDKSQVKRIVDGQHMESPLEESNSADAAIDYLSSYVAQGIPVVVGVDHTYNRSLSKADNSTSSKNTRGYNEGTTDHFVTIVGQGINESGQRYFQFFDPGTQHQGKATSDKNQLIESSPNCFEADQPWADTNGNTKHYTLSLVILFKKDIKAFQSYIDENKAKLEELDKDFNSKKGDFGNLN